MDSRESVQHIITEKFAQKTGEVAENINPEQEFPDMGLNSIQLTDLLSDLEKTLDIEIEMGALYLYSNITSFSEYLASNFPDKVNKMIRQH